MTGAAASAPAPAGVATPRGLVWVSDQAPGIRRIRVGADFAYVGPDGKRLRKAVELQRIRALAIPPAYEDVWICVRANGHIQATGRDARGRKQYRYHRDWRLAKDADTSGDGRRRMRTGAGSTGPRGSSIAGGTPCGFCGVGGNGVGGTGSGG